MANDRMGIQHMENREVRGRFRKRQADSSRLVYRRESGKEHKLGEW